MVHILQFPLWVTNSTIAAIPTNIYTKFSKAGHEPKMLFTRLKSKAPQRPQLRPPMTIKMKEMIWRIFV